MTPIPKEHKPITAIAAAMEWIRFLNPPHDAIQRPPPIIPIEKAISIAVKRQTSSPNERATCSGERNDTGAAIKKAKEKYRNSLLMKA